MKNRTEYHKNKIKIKCEMCKKIFFRNHYRIFKNGKKRKKRNFCSERCFYKWLKVGYKGKNNPRWNQKKIKCYYCGRIFLRINSQINISKRHFCSQDCYGKYKAKNMVGKNNPQHSKRMKGENNPNFGRGKLMSGKNNSNWRGGLSFEPYANDWTQSLKQEIKKRDEYVCQLCNKPEKECLTKLNIHHIDYDKKNCNERNLISLCSECHAKTLYDREFWKIIFSEKIKEIYSKEKKKKRGKYQKFNTVKKLY